MSADGGGLEDLGAGMGNLRLVDAEEEPPVEFVEWNPNDDADEVPDPIYAAVEHDAVEFETFSGTGVSMHISMTAAQNNEFVWKIGQEFLREEAVSPEIEGLQIDYVQCNLRLKSLHPEIYLLKQQLVLGQQKESLAAGSEQEQFRLRTNLHLLKTKIACLEKNLKECYTILKDLDADARLITRFRRWQQLLINKDFETLKKEVRRCNQEQLREIFHIWDSCCLSEGPFRINLEKRARVIWEILSKGEWNTSTWFYEAFRADAQLGVNSQLGRTFASLSGSSKAEFVGMTDRRMNDLDDPMLQKAHLRKLLAIDRLRSPKPKLWPQVREHLVTLLLYDPLSKNIFSQDDDSYWDNASAGDWSEKKDGGDSDDEDDDDDDDDEESAFTGVSLLTG